MPKPLFPDASQYSPVPLPAQDSKDEVHLQLLFATSQYSPVSFPAHELDDPHLHSPLTQISPTLHSRSGEHLQIPLPLLAEASQYCPPVQEARVEVHLQTLYVASQYSPVIFPAQDSRDAVHLQRSFVASQYCPVISPAHESRDEVHLQMLSVASQYSPVGFAAQELDDPHLH